MNGIREDWKKLANPSVIKEALRIATSNPLVFCRYVIHGRQKAIQPQIQHLLEYMGTNTSGLKDYWGAIASKRDLYAYVLKASRGIYYGDLRTPEFLYVIVRVFKPELVVETGVAAGISSTFILQALQDNNKGRLYSIDFPNYSLIHASHIPEGEEPGFAIPQNLKGRWKLRLGKSKDLLPSLLAELGRVDIFLHDSEHTYENMMFEYTTAWDYLREEGLLLSHDISWNNAFRDFSRAVERKPIEIHLTGTGAIVK